MADPLYIGSDKRLNLTGLTGDGVALNAATVTWVLKAVSDGSVVTSGTLSYVAASTGNYTGVIDKAVTLTLSEGSIYQFEVTISSGTYDDFRRFKTKAAYRDET